MKREREETSETKVDLAAGGSVAEFLSTYKSQRAEVSLAAKFGAAPQQLAKRPKTQAQAPAGGNGPQFGLSKVLLGHSGWVTCVAVDPANRWFATGSNDASIKVWDLAAGSGRLTLTGHTMAVNALCISETTPYMYSGGMDRALKQWDLESNQVVHSFHGHRSALLSVALSPTLDLAAAGCRDGSVHLWDTRSRQQLFRLKGAEREPVTQVLMRGTDPQLVSASEAGVKFWDLRTGTCVHALTSHTHAVGAVACTAQDSLVSGSHDSLRKWGLPGGHELEAADNSSYVHSLSISPQNIMAATLKSGQIALSDLKHSVVPYRMLASPLLPGSLESESPALCSAFDFSGTCLITGHADKSVRVWREREREK